VAERGRGEREKIKDVVSRAPHAPHASILKQEYFPFEAVCMVCVYMSICYVRRCSIIYIFYCLHVLLFCFLNTL